METLTTHCDGCGLAFNYYIDNEMLIPIIPITNAYGSFCKE